MFRSNCLILDFLFFHLKLNNLGQKLRLECLASVFPNILIIGIRIMIGAFGKRSGVEDISEDIFAHGYVKN